MKLRKNFKLMKKIIAISALFYAILSPITIIFASNAVNVDFSNNLNTQANDSAEDSILWKLGKGLPGTGATMKPRLVNFTENGESLIIVGTDKGLAAVTLDGFISMSYRTFGPVIDFDIIEDISGDDIDDIVLITYYKDHPNLIAISSNNGSEIWKFKATIEGISTETYEKQDFITYTWDLEVINDINEDSISEIVITSWYRLIVVDGKVGDKLWMRESDFANDIWKVEVLEDINNNGFQTIIAGSEEGKLSAFDSESGKKLWTFKVEEMKIPVTTMFGISTENVPNSIDDIKIVNDVDNDDIDEILVAADDGYLRLISGKNGHELYNAICYNMTKIKEYLYDIPSTSPYSSTERLFRKSGVKLYEIPDINNDGIKEYMSIACDLDYEDKETNLIESRIFCINPETESELINISISRNWTYSYSDMGRYYSSDPEIINRGFEIQIYFYSVISDPWDSRGNARIERYHIEDEKSENPTIIYEDPDSYSFSRDEFEILSQTSTYENGYYLLNIGDVNFDGVDDLFAISPNGRYLCIDMKNEDMLWVRTRKDSELEITELKDLNNDGIKDLLIEQISNFEPDWISETDGDERKEKPRVVSGLYTVDGRTGNVIWSFNIPLPQYYEGVRDLKNVGDITDDEIDDYVGWVIPSITPPDISEIIESLSERDPYEWDSGEVVSEDIYRALLSKYTKILAIDGSNGIIFWNKSLLGFPYRFYRQYGYTGPYEEPILGYSDGNDFYNRINDEIPSSWGEYYIDWNGEYNNWSISTLLHPDNIQLVNGSSTDNEFDLWGDEDTNFTITSSNSSESSKSLKIGTTLNSTSIGTVESGDNSYWVLNSISSNGEHKINAELSFNLSQPVESELQHIVVDYEGFVYNKEIDQIDIFIYNFSNGGYWQKISTDDINDPDPSTKMVKRLYEINGLTFDSNKLVKIKLEATNASAFSLYIDKLVVNYTYSYGNYTIMAEHDGTSWKAIMDLTIPIDFSDDDLLGVMEYPLSQIERFSALKLQTKLKVNTSGWYNFTYEIYDVSNSKWVLCNWSKSKSTWNDHTYPDLKGGYGDTRYDYKDFYLDSNYKHDHMWLVTRGTSDGTDDYYPYLEFDYENRTTLSNFIDLNQNIQIRLNITDVNPFNLTIDNFGIGAFYWGLFSSYFDRYYIMEYHESSEPEFTTNNLLNLEIQDFDVVNGTNDGYLDIIAIIGNEIYNYDKTWSTRIRLFDIKNKEVYTKWSLNQTYIPYQNVRILPINNSLNNWLISGNFQFGTYYNFSHKLIGNPHWNSQISHFNNYSDSKVEIDYLWEEIPDFPQQYDYEFPGKTTISREGRIGIMLGEYELLEEEWGELRLRLTNIRIIDINSHSIVSKIPAEKLDYLSYYDGQEVGKIDFSSEGAGYKLLISYEDFNDDNFLDHVGLYSLGGIDEEYFMDSESGTEVRIYSGNSGDSDPVILFSKIFEFIQPGYSEYISPDELTMPFTSVDDINNDEVPEAIIGIQSGTDRCKGSYISFYDIFNSNEYEVKELTEYKWELDTFKCISRWAERYDEFVFDIDKIGDINADNISEIYINRDYFIETRREYGYRTYERIPTTEILDIFNQNTIYRFNIEVDSLLPIVDLNEDGKKEILISSEEILYCINSKFGIQILSPKDEQSMGSHNFNIKWDTDSDYDYFEVFIDGVSQGHTIAKKIHVSLGSGWREISIMLYDKSGLIIAISTINVLVPPNQTHLILTFVFLAVAAGLYIGYRRISKKKEEMVFIDKKIKEGGKKK